MIMIFLASYFLVTAIFIYTLIFIIIYLIAMDYTCTSAHLHILTLIVNLLYYICLLLKCLLFTLDIKNENLSFAILVFTIISAAENVRTTLCSSVFDAQRVL